ncbi:MAG: GGDEF domain-containing protein [Candidatus Dormiibacterota bacterium]
MTTDADINRPSSGAPKLSYLVRDDLLQAVLAFFSVRMGVRVWFQDPSGYTIAPEHEIPMYCSMLINHNRCGLSNSAVDMPPDASLPLFRTCVAGIGHLIIPIQATTPSGAVTELGRIITEPVAIRETTFEETFEEAQKMHIHPDNLYTEASKIKVVDAEELKQMATMVQTVVGRVASERSSQARNLELAEAFEQIGLRGNREVMDELLTNLVREFTGADAAVLTTAGEGGEELVHQASFNSETDDDRRGLILEFTGEVTRWISQTGYPISFPDLEGSSWCRHVLNGKALPGSLVSVPIKLPDDWSGWWTAYFSSPTPEMEDQIHRLSVLAAHTAQTLSFLAKLEATQEQALTDPLTGLRNRRFLVDELDREVARSSRSRSPVSLILLDIDNFKDVNDNYGHVVGDKALKHVASVMSQPLRRSSVICRYGGDEFCIVVPECGAEEAQLVAQRIKQEIENQPLFVEGVGPVQLFVSGGVATEDPEAPLEQDLFEVADQELIRAKRQGKGRIGVA